SGAGQKGDYQSVYSILFILCTVCLSGSHDVSGYFVSYFQHFFRNRRFCGGADCGISREKSSDRGCLCLCGGVSCGKNFAFCGLKKAKYVFGRRAGPNRKGGQEKTGVV